jgi:hypothetical protein
MISTTSARSPTASRTSDPRIEYVTTIRFVPFDGFDVVLLVHPATAAIRAVAATTAPASRR